MTSVFSSWEAKIARREHRLPWWKSVTEQGTCANKNKKNPEHLQLRGPPEHGDLLPYISIAT